MKRALITGATGQDGTYLSSLLCTKGYEVHLQSRQTPIFPAQSANLIWHCCDIGDRRSLEDLCLSIKPAEIYNLAAISIPQATWDCAIETAHVNGLIPLYILETMRTSMPDCRLYQASSSEMFGDTEVSPQNEKTPFQPQTPYAISKLFAHNMATVYRMRYGLFACTGILFNHESPRRPLSFVMQKIAHAAALISSGVRDSEELDERGRPLVASDRVALGDIDVSRDFGYADDYVNAMWLMLQHENADVYVVGSGESHSIRDICKVAFDHVNLNYEEHITLDPHLLRSADNRYTIADASKARNVLGWKPSKSFHDLVRMMVDHRLQIVANRRPAVAL